MIWRFPFILYIWFSECFSTFRIDSDVAKCMEGNYDVYTALKVPGMSTGYVEIGPVCESCSVIDSNLVSIVFSSWWLCCMKFLRSWNEVI